MKPLRAFGKLALTAAAAAVIAACGGSSSDAPKGPSLKLAITATEAFPGTYGDVGEYERVTGTISGDGAVVSGSGEAGATISVTNAAGTVLGTATVAGNGSFSVTLSSSTPRCSTTIFLTRSAVSLIFCPFFFGIRDFEDRP